MLPGFCISTDNVLPVQYCWVVTAGALSWDFGYSMQRSFR
jgi:hypothetical protein